MTMMKRVSDSRFESFDLENSRFESFDGIMTIKYYNNNCYLNKGSNCLGRRQETILVDVNHTEI
jgi:hypothetical protein